MNQKAQFEIRKTIYWTITTTVITIMIFAFAMQLVKFQKDLTKIPPQLQAEYTSLRFINSPDCFAYNEGERTYPGIVDIKKFKTDILNKCYPVKDRNFNFGLKLKKERKELRTTHYYVNNRDFTLTKNVLIKKGEKTTPDLLEIAVQIS